MMGMSSLYERMLERYALGQLPWDEELPPPEVMATLATLPAGRALDLGCGYGRAAIYMAQQGWEVDGVDFIPQAIEEAGRRGAAAGVAVRWHLADMMELTFLTPPYDLALDVGCCHALDTPQLHHYLANLQRLLRPAGLYLLYARLRQVDEPSTFGPRGLYEPDLLRLLADDFTLEQATHGAYGGQDAGWPSAWYWFRRRPA